MSLHVLAAGPHSLPVDFGRPHARGLGVPVGGAADRASLALGNALLGNPPDAVALEVSLAGPTLRAVAPAACALFGAPFSLRIDGRGDVPAGTTFTLEPGDVLRIGGTPTLARGYLCVAGGFDVPEVLGSRSGLDPLRPGDLLVCRTSRARGRRSLPFLNFDGPPDVLRAVDGPQRDWFPATGFYDRPYRVAAASNRMGVRLSGEPLSRTPGELASEPVAPGAVQVTNDGLPVVLGADGQTIGGYPKVAHVVRADLDRVGQLRPGAEVRFVRVSLAEAGRIARERAAELRGWAARLRATAEVELG